MTFVTVWPLCSRQFRSQSHVRTVVRAMCLSVHCPPQFPSTQGWVLQALAAARLWYNCNIIKNTDMDLINRPAASTWRVGQWLWWTDRGRPCRQDSGAMEFPDCDYFRITHSLPELMDGHLKLTQPECSIGKCLKPGGLWNNCWIDLLQCLGGQALRYLNNHKMAS